MPDEEKSSKTIEESKTSKDEPKRQFVFSINNFKLGLFGLCFIIALFALLFRIYQIKAEDGEKYEAQAINQLISSSRTDKIIEPIRGNIVDRNNTEFLAVSTVIYDVFMDVRLLVKAKENVVNNSLEACNEALGIPMETLRSYLEIDPETGKPKIDRNEFYIAKGVSSQVKAELEAKKPLHIHTKLQTKRSYPYNSLAYSVIGFYMDSFWGLERQYNTSLKGTPGRTFNQYDKSGMIKNEYVKPINGYTLVTTLDLDLQQSSEELVEKYAKLYNAQNASAIVMNPYNGEILSMASYPSLNLNDPTNPEFINNPKLSEELKTLDEEELYKKLNNLWKNFNVTDTFEQGSIFKPITVGMALDEGVISLSETFYCGGKKVVADREIHCHKRTGHGHITLDEALAYSCNVAMMEIAEKLGREKFYQHFKDFGFGERTGIDLPAEERGIIHPYSGFFDTELATTSFGQRFNCTPIQVITAFAATINGGNIVKPYLVSQMIDDNNNVVYEHTPVISRKVLSLDTSDYLRVTMKETLESEGTGRLARIPGYNIGGKTGTGEQGVKDTPGYSHSIAFAAYLPVENPQYVALVLVHKVDEEIYDAGNATPSPMLQELLLDIIRFKGIPQSYEVDKNEFISDNIISLENYVGRDLPEVIQNINSHGFDFEIVGAGGSKVVSQYPNPGTNITKNASVLLTVEKNGDEELITVPNVVKKSSDEASTVLTDLGLIPKIFIAETLDDETDEDNTETPPEESVAPTENTETETESQYIERTVYMQMPEEGVLVPVGTEIKLKVK